MSVLILLLLLAVGNAVAGPCHDCWGRGALVGGPLSASYCTCNCSYTTEDADSSVPHRLFNTTLRLTLLPPTCRYSNLERQIFIATVGSPTNSVISSIFAEKVRVFLQLRFDDQVVVHSLVPTSKQNVETIVRFDVREDRTGHNYSDFDLAIETPLARHRYLMMNTYLPLIFGSDMNVLKLEVENIEDSPTVLPSTILGHMGGKPIYLESAVIITSAMVITTLLSLAEAAISSNYVTDEIKPVKEESPLERQKRRRSKMEYLTPGADNAGGDEELERKPSNVGRRQSQVVDEPVSPPFDGEVSGDDTQDDPPPMERKKSRAKSTYFIG
jgi:hypothetical protein